MARKGKPRLCRGCGCTLLPEKLWLCDECSAAGVGTRLNPHRLSDREELLGVARAREAAGLDPLEGMSLEDKTALAWCFRRTGYGSYGKMTGYVRANGGRLPPMEPGDWEASKK